MSVSELKRHGIILAMFCSIAVILSLIWKVPYLYMAIGFAAWAFGGHLITVDDDLPDGWNNSDGNIPFPWAELAVKAAVLLILVGLVLFIPKLRTLGA
ncbi:hypothetical protein [Massilia sp.]|uniref:hypothetical protein n=1 Tax=Massilia sp. TaxID=1882437 RepID=UPI00352D5B1B